MKGKTVILVATAMLLGAIPAMAHFPPLPDTNCSDGTDGTGKPLPHDFVGATSATVTTGITGEFGGGITIVFDGSLLPCDTEDFCPPGEDFFVYDPNDDIGADPPLDPIVVECNDLPTELQTLQIPLGDGEYEFGLSGAFLPATPAAGGPATGHHDPLTNGYQVDADSVDGGFIFGSDEDNDGDVEEGSVDCFESHSTATGNSTGNEFTTLCTAGLDGGWWFFTKCNVTTLSDWTFTTNGPLLRLGLGDDDGDDVPNSLEDDDSDGLPNGLDDSNTADDFVNPNWNPTLTPGSGPPGASASCLLLGHINDDLID